MPRSLNYHHLRYFRAVARSGNLTRTAEELNLSQSALSAQIRKLEERLGHDLFERKGRQLVLTEAGHVALAYAEAIFAAGEALVATLTEGTPLAAQELRIGALATLSRNFQIAFLRPLLGAQNVVVKVRSGRLEELTSALEAYEVDVVLTNQSPEPGASPNLIRHEVARQAVGLIASPSRVREDDTADTLLGREPVVLPAAGTSIRADFEAYCERRGIEPRIVAEVDDMAMLRLLTREGHAMGVVPPIVVRDELESGELALAAELPGIFEAFYAITLRRLFPNPLVQQLLPTT
jgi:LysR family transcriptional activator of nhaA